MKMKFDRFLRFTKVLLIAALLLLPSYLVLAQGDDKATVEIELVSERTTLTVGESSTIILTVHNTTPYTLTGVSTQLQGSVFKLINLPNLTDTISPYASTQAEYTLQSQTIGSHNAIFVVQYSWDDLDTGISYQWLEMVSVEDIEVITPPAFAWPDYLIPLVIGLITGQLIALLNDWRKQRQEKHQQEEQARGITLAVLQTARKGIQEQEPISFALWEEAIVKGNLYPALHRLGRTMGKPELSKQLAELSIILIDYNNRQSGSMFPDGMIDEISDELTTLIEILENKR